MKKLITYICIIVCLCSTTLPPIPLKAETKITSAVSWPKGPNPSSLSAESAIVMEASTGLVLYKKNINEKHYPASITKIMTTLLCLENSSLDETVTFSKNAVYGIEPGSSHIAIDVGEKLSMKDTLYGIMLESANEACLGAAEHVAGSVDDFVNMMNAKAKSLGCKNTHFVNPNGLHDDNHYTTVYDMALISQAALQNETFRMITNTKSHVIPATNLKESREWIKNHHQMLNGYKYPKYKYEYCIGGKTGYTTKAKNTLVTFGKKNNLTLICVIMRAGSPSVTPNEYIDTKQLLDFGFKSYNCYNLNSSDHDTTNEIIPLFTKYSALFNKKNSPIYISDNAKFILPKEINPDAAKRSLTYKNISSIQEGENIIGTVTYTYGENIIGTGDIIYNKMEHDSLKTETKITHNEKEVSLDKKFALNSTTIIILIISSIIIIALLYYVFLIRARRRKNSYYIRTHRSIFKKRGRY